jgi:hypothetical protein
MNWSTCLGRWGYTGVPVAVRWGFQTTAFCAQIKNAHVCKTTATTIPANVKLHKYT